MITLSFAVNLLVLFPLLSAFQFAPTRMETVFGPATDARAILVCLYATIALASLFGLTLIGLGHIEMAIALAVPLFAMQIVYKLMTVPMVGLSSPVVMTNLVVVAVHAATLISLMRN